MVILQLSNGGDFLVWIFAGISPLCMGKEETTLLHIKSAKSCSIREASISFDEIKSYRSCLPSAVDPWPRWPESVYSARLILVEFISRYQIGCVISYGFFAGPGWKVQFEEVAMYVCNLNGKNQLLKFFDRRVLKWAFRVRNFFPKMLILAFGVILVSTNICNWTIFPSHRR